MLSLVFWYLFASLLEVFLFFVVIFSLSVFWGGPSFLLLVTLLNKPSAFKKKREKKSKKDWDIYNSTVVLHCVAKSSSTHQFLPVFIPALDAMVERVPCPAEHDHKSYVTSLSSWRMPGRPVTHCPSPRLPRLLPMGQRSSSTHGHLPLALSHPGVYDFVVDIVGSLKYLVYCAWSFGLTFHVILCLCTSSSFILCTTCAGKSAACNVSSFWQSLIVNFFFQFRTLQFTRDCASVTECLIPFSG